MKVKTSELTGKALNWAVALAEGHQPPLLRVLRGNVALPCADDPMWCDYLDYSTDWAQGGPIIEREGINTNKYVADPLYSEPYWIGTTWEKAKVDRWMRGPTPLIAAMRCFVASKLGDEVDIPEELL